MINKQYNKCFSDFLVIILARKNSKRLKNKNIKIFNKKPLIYWTIMFAKKKFANNNIVVSTDCKKIKKISEKLNVICEWPRPNKYSLDNAKSEDTVIYCLKWYEKNFIKKKNIILLQPTSPFRDFNQFNKAIQLFLKKKINIISVSKGKNNDKSHFFYKRKKYLKYSNKNNFNKNFFRPNGNFYICKAANIIKYKNFYMKNTIGSYTKKKYSIDIDNQNDFDAANLYLKKYFKNYHKNFL